MCAADCMAWLTTAPEGPDFKGQAFSNCMILVNLHRTGKHLAILAADVKKIVTVTQQEAADRVRHAGSVPIR